MTDILPQNSTLPVIYEGTNFVVEFESSLDSGETLDEIKITSNDLPDAITIDGSKFYGNFSGLFTLPTDSLKYRLGDELFATDSFAKLPPKGTADLYSYTAPGEMLNIYTIQVEMTYKKGESSEVLNISKIYNQPVRGSWDSFLNMFLNYVR